MHPFRKNNKSHSKMNASRCFKQAQMHPFVKSQLKLSIDIPDSKNSNNNPETQIRIVKKEALEQVVRELNLLKNKN